MYIHSYVHTFICTYIHMYIHSYVHTFICTYIHVYIHSYVQTFICHTYIYVYIEVHREKACNTMVMHTLYNLTCGLTSNECQRLARFKWTGILVFWVLWKSSKHIMKYNRTSIWSHPVSLYVYHIMILVYFTVGSTSSGSAFVIAPILGAKTIFESISLWSQLLPLYFLIQFTDSDPPYFCTI
jgi:hypothetical protein